MSMLRGYKNEFVLEYICIERDTVFKTSLLIYTSSSVNYTLYTLYTINYISRSNLYFATPCSKILQYKQNKFLYRLTRQATT